MRQKLAVANWKMNFTNDEAVSFVKALSTMIKGRTVVCAPFTAVSDLCRLNIENIDIGAQNINDHDSGAYTGEISGQMLKAAGVKYGSIGHSERRIYYKESDQDINLKVKAALKHGLKPIFCLGETSEERSCGKTNEVIKRKLKEGLKDISSENMNNIIIAYEPVWAISTFQTGQDKKAATNEDAEDAHKFIREKICEIYGNYIAEGLTILYGGSAKPENIGELMQQEDIDGCLVGGASLETGNLSEMVNIVNR